MVVHSWQQPTWQRPKIEKPPVTETPPTPATPATSEKKPVQRSVRLERGFDRQLRNARFIITQPNRKGEAVVTGYDLHKVASDWGEAYLLQKDDGEQYHVLIEEGNHICDCADALFRGRWCKHIRACIALREQNKII